METIFLLDLFAGDPALIERWRFADKKARMKDFSPIKVREALDAREGFTSKKRFEMYELFSELAGHPNMKSSWMMRPQKDGDAVIGPFMEATALEAVISEIGRLAVQVGEQLDRCFPANWDQGVPSRVAFAQQKQNWINTFYPTAARGPYSLDRGPAIHCNGSTPNLVLLALQQRRTEPIRVGEHLRHFLPCSACLAEPVAAPRHGTMTCSGCCA
jgi:hypothetical protein